MTRSRYNQLLQQFGQWVIDEHRCDLGDINGKSIQDKLEELDLLERVVVIGPCGEDCWCSEYMDEWPTRCLRLVMIEDAIGDALI